MPADESYPDDLLYHPAHDWARVDGDHATFGVTWYAQDSLGDVVVFLPPEVGQQVTAKIDTWPGASFAGEISAINPVVSASTRNVQVRATLKNPDEKMLPGMFATIDIDLGAPKDYVTVPKTAISYNSYGNIAYVIELKSEGKGVAHQTFVKTGPTRGDQVAVLDGVKPGDIVATAGQTKLNDGSPVIINNEVTPPFSANPQVSEE